MELERIRQQLRKPQPRFIGEEQAFRSAVIVPLIKKDNRWHILFEVRSVTMRKQPGDISFPGGQIDETDASIIEAAKRETEEELGIDHEQIDIVEELSPLVMSPSFVVYPVVAVIPDETHYTLNPDEVGSTFTIPVDWLLSHEAYRHYVLVKLQPKDDFPYDKIARGRDYKWRSRDMEEWFYEYEGHTVWGLTARILRYVIEQLKKDE